MEDRQWLQTWQAVCQKEAEMKLTQQRNSENFRHLDMKMRLMDLRIETAFKIRDDYLTTLLQKYPNWKPRFVSVGLPRKNDENKPAKKTELAVSQLVDMDMLQNWDDRITLDQLIQSKMRNRNLHISDPDGFAGGDRRRSSSGPELKNELEQMKKQLNEIFYYLRDLRAGSIIASSANVNGNISYEPQQPKTTVSISRKTSFKDKEYSATEHIRLPKAPDASGTENFEEDDDYVDEGDYEIPKQPEVRPAPATATAKTKQPERKPVEPAPAPQPPATSVPRFNFGGGGGPAKDPAGKVVTPPPEDASPPVLKKEIRPLTIKDVAKKVTPTPVRESKKPEPTVTKATAAVAKPATVAVAKQPTKDKSPRKQQKQEAFFTDPIKSEEQPATPESTPEVAKSSKVVQSYEALLGIIGGSTVAKKTNSDSDESSADDLEKRLKSPPSVDVSSSKKLSQVQLPIQTTMSSTPLPSSSNLGGLDFLSTKPAEKKVSLIVNSPPKSRVASSNALSVLGAKEPTKSTTAAAKPEEPLSDPDDFLAKLFPDKFGGPTTKKAEEKPKSSGVASLFGDRKPNKSAFFIGEDSDSETVDIPKKKTQQADDDFDFFN